jgi:hypothetical protein
MPADSLFGLYNNYSVWATYLASIAPESLRLVDDSGEVIRGASLTSASGFQYTPAVPEASTLWLGATGGLVLVLAVRRQAPARRRSVGG